MGQAERTVIPRHPEPPDSPHFGRREAARPIEARSRMREELHGSRTSGAAAGVRRLVPQDYSTILAAINASANGDTVLVAEGLYFENVNYKGKAIVVASIYLTTDDTSHISRTIIDGSKPGNTASASVVYFVSREDTNSVLCGFTITGGKGTYLPAWATPGASRITR
jgi:hypothetical protein